jgi:hypothetical protein
MSRSFTESVVEQAALAWLEGLGFHVVGPLALRAKIGDSSNWV